MYMSRTRRDDARVAGIIDRIRDIPRGSVQAYSDIDPAAPRLVGRVLATTHEDVPWHRVGGSKAHARTMRRVVAAVRASEVRTATGEDGKLTCSLRAD